MKTNKLAKAIVFIGVFWVFCASGGEYIKIINPSDEDIVNWDTRVNGTYFSVSEKNFYVLIWPLDSTGPWWVQTAFAINNSSWQSRPYFGRDPLLYPSDSGSYFRVIAIMTNETFEPGQAIHKLPYMPQLIKSQEIIVRRK